MFSGYERAYAPPVVRDSFSYSGRGLYVTIDYHHHERADPGTLHRLLTYTEPAPRLTKAGKVAKRQPTPHKDEPGHFYCAQLLHYGLKPLKTKEPAKKQLLAAFTANGTLSVPQHILTLEDTLRKEWDEANVIAKAKYEEEKQAREIEEERQRKKRKRENDAFMREILDDDIEVLSGFESQSSDKEEISQAQLRDAITTLPEKDLRNILTTLVDDIPEVEQAVIREVKKLQSSNSGKAHRGKKLKVNPKATTSKGKQKQSVRHLSFNCASLVAEIAGIIYLVS
jgi:hypothetical protein